MYEKPTVNVIVSDGRLHVFLLSSSRDHEQNQVSALTFRFSIILVALEVGISEEKEVKCTHSGIKIYSYNWPVILPKKLLEIH